VSICELAGFAIGTIAALADCMKKTSARRVLRLDRETVRPLHRTAIEAARGGLIRSTDPTCESVESGGSGHVNCVSCHETTT